MSARRAALQISVWLPLVMIAWGTAGADTFMAPDSVQAAADGSFHYQWVYVVGLDPITLAGLGWSNDENTQGEVHGDCFCGPFCVAPPGDTIRWNVDGQLIDQSLSGRARNWVATCSGGGGNLWTVILPHSTTDVNDLALQGRLEFSNWPNPCRGRTTFYYSLPAPGFVQIRLYDVTGRWISTPLSRAEESGTHSLSWDANHAGGVQLDKGVYFARLNFKGHVRTRPMLVVN